MKTEISNAGTQEERLAEYLRIFPEAQEQTRDAVVATYSRGDGKYAAPITDPQEQAETQKQGDSLLKAMGLEPTPSVR